MRACIGSHDSPHIRPGLFTCHPDKLVDLAALLGHELLDTTVMYMLPAQEGMAEDLDTSGLNADR
ncbi:MAG: hypothetical protein MRJ68_20125 [Nitrospira sp.]|nr:hypothetical protein [Nitrospira sp.]